MGRPRVAEPKSRLTLELPDMVVEAIADLQDALQAESKTEVVRRSVLGMRELARLCREGSLYFERDGERVRLLVPFDAAHLHRKGESGTQGS